MSKLPSIRRDRTPPDSWFLFEYRMKVYGHRSEEIPFSITLDSFLSDSVSKSSFDTKR